MTSAVFPGGLHALPRLVVAVLTTLLLSAGAQAVMVPLGEADLARGADGIVLGTVTSAGSHWTAGRGIETTAEIAVESTVKGAFPSRSVTVTARGGAVGGIAEAVEDEPVLAAGDRGFYLLERSASGYRVHGARQGVVPVVGGEVLVPGGAGAPRAVPAAAYGRHLAALAGGREAALGGALPAMAGGPAIASVSPARAPAGTGATITITGTGFGPESPRESKADVGFVYRCTSGSSYVPIYASGRPSFGSNPNEIVSWTDTRIVVRVPVGVTSDGYDGSASSGMVWVVDGTGAASAPASFAVPFGYGQVRWTESPSYVVTSNCPGVTDAPAAVARAAGTWNAAVPAAAFRLVNGGTADSTATDYDGTNRICWKPASAFSSPATLAVTTWWYNASTSSILECDVQFNAGFTWTTGTASGSDHSVEAIMLHEFGHWLNLRDLYGFCDGRPTDTAKVMFGFNNAGFGNLNLRTLSADDVQGIRYIYGGAPTTTPTATPTAAPDLAGGTLAAPGWEVGRSFTVTNAVRNAGAAASGPFEVEFCLSSDAAITPADTVIGTRSYAGLGAGAAGPALETAVAVPASVPDGAYFLAMRIDPADAVAESDESNNMVVAGSPVVLTRVAALPGAGGPPLDLDQDGRYDDLNRNGRTDFGDVVLFFTNLDWIVANEPVAAFDHNGNGRIDLSDVVRLFEAL